MPIRYPLYIGSSVSLLFPFWNWNFLKRYSEDKTLCNLTHSRGPQGRLISHSALFISSTACFFCSRESTSLRWILSHFLFHAKSGWDGFWACSRATTMARGKHRMPSFWMRKMERFAVLNGSRLTWRCFTWLCPLPCWYMYLTWNISKCAAPSVMVNSFLDCCTDSILLKRVASLRCLLCVNSH